MTFIFVTKLFLSTLTHQPGIEEIESDFMVYILYLYQVYDLHSSYRDGDFFLFIICGFLFKFMLFNLELDNSSDLQSWLLSIKY